MTLRQIINMAASDLGIGQADTEKLSKYILDAYNLGVDDTAKAMERLLNEPRSNDKSS